MKITYRNANLSDLRKLSVLFKQVYIATYGIDGVSDEFANFITDRFALERLEPIISHSPENMMVAEYRGNLVGVAELEWNKQCPVGDFVSPELSKLYILEWFCGKGLGRQLLEQAEKTVMEKGSSHLWLWVLASNTRAIHFYQQQGYREIGHAWFQMEVNQYDNIVMRKDLYLVKNQ